MADTFAVDAVTVTHLVGAAALYCRYPSQTDEQDCYVELDCEKETLSAGYNGEVGNAVPSAVHHGLVRRYEIACLCTDAANALLDALAPLAQRVVDGYSAEWDGNNHVGRLDEDATEAESEIERLCEATLDDDNDDDKLAVCEAADWFSGHGDEDAQRSELGITSKTTDDEIAAIVKREELAIVGVADVVDDIEGYLTNLRDNAVIDAAYTAFALKGLSIRSAGGWTLIKDGTDTWLTRAEELKCSPSTSDHERVARQRQIDEDDGSEAYTDLCSHTSVSASREGGQCEEEDILSAVRGRLIDCEDVRTYWPAAGKAVICGCEACGEEAFIIDAEPVDNEGTELDGWDTDDNGVWLCGNCQSYSVDSVTGECVCESCDAPEITWGGIQTGQPGVANWQDGVDEDGGVWRRHDRGGWTAPERVGPADDDQPEIDVKLVTRTSGPGEEEQCIEVTIYGSGANDELIAERVAQFADSLSGDEEAAYQAACARGDAPVPMTWRDCTSSGRRVGTIDL